MRSLPDFSSALQVVAENLVVLIARAVLALFLSFVLGILLYVVTLPAVQHFARIAELNFALYGVLVIGIGAGIGSFLGWLNRDLGLWFQMLVLFLTLAAALIGAWGGLHNSRDVVQLSGSLGSPLLLGVTVGAILGANIFNLALWLVKIFRNPRI